MIDRNKCKYTDLELPKKTNFKTRMILWWSKFINDLTIWNWNRKLWK